MNTFEKLWPYPRQISHDGTEFSSPPSVFIEGESPISSLSIDLKSLGICISNVAHGYSLKLAIDPKLKKSEGYRINIDEQSASITGSDRAGLRYGIETFLQIVAIYRHKSKWPKLLIEDSPTYKKRCFMADLGRGAYTMPMLKRIVRILARLKMNQLHLHLYDDELCGIRFEGLPFGWDNQYSISIPELGELVSYAAKYDVEIVPEVEGWAHVTSIVYHRPELRGGDGMFNGSSFLIGPDVFALMKEITRQIVSVMPKKATIHFGLDEAKWFLAPGMPEEYSPEDLVRSYYDMLQELATESGKELTMRIWADHGGRPVSDDIKNNIIIEPWQYWNSNTGLIEKQIENYSGKDKMRFMMGAGQSMAQHRGAYHATRYWCKNAMKSPNADGVNITFWGRNDLLDCFITLFAGAYYAWNPESPIEWTSTEDYEEYDRYVFPVMRWWQSNFRDAFPDDMRNDSAPFVYNGFHVWGENHGKPVAQTAVAANTLCEHDFLQEDQS